MKTAVLSVAALLAAIAAPQVHPAPSAPPTPDDINWRVSGGAARPTLTLSRTDRSSGTVALGDAPLLATALDSGSVGPVRFTVDREAGVIACTGNLHAGSGRGTCRFTASPAFERGLAGRGLALRSRSELFDLALVDATLARADALTRGGVGPKDAGELIVAAALDLSGEYLRELKDAGLRVDDVDDLVASRALVIDAAYLRGLAEAGYPELSVDQAIGMKAVGVTPDFARALNAAASTSVRRGDDR